MSSVGNWRGPNIVKDGLVFYTDPGSPNSYYNKSGTTITDISGNNLTGSLTNGPTYDSSNGGSNIFDGVNDYIVASTKVVDSTYPGLTFECWVKPTKAATSIIAANGSTYLNSGIQLAQETGTYFSFLIDGSGGQYDGIYANTNTYTINTWYHLVGRWIPGQVVNIYMNGTLSNGTPVSQGAQTALFNSNSNLHIGIRPGLTLPYTGNIATVRIYNRGLSVTEILQNYNATKGRFGL